MRALPATFGVPAAVSVGGATGLPERPRDGRGVADFAFAGDLAPGALVVGVLLPAMPGNMARRAAWIN